MLEIVDLETLAFDAIVTQGMTKRERVLGVPFPHIFSGTRRCEKHFYEFGNIVVVWSPANMHMQTMKTLHGTTHSNS